MIFEYVRELKTVQFKIITRPQEAVGGVLVGCQESFFFLANL